MAGETETQSTTEKPASRRRARRSAGTGLVVIDESPSKRQPAGIVVVDAPLPIYELRKATEALSIRNISTGEITFLVRKAYNVMLQVAQEQIAASGNEEQITFECTLREFERRIGHSTPNSRDHLKHMLRQLTTFTVEFDYRGSKKGKVSSWGVANMVSEVYLIEDTGSIRWSFPPELKKKMLDPAVYNLIDLRTQMQFTSHSALALYEVCSRYFTSPSKMTYQQHWTEWSMALSGASEPHRAFKDFNKMMTRALEQVRNVASDFTITPTVTKRERKYDQLWFTVERKKQGELLASGTPAAVSQELQKTLTALGLAGDLGDLMAAYDEEYLLAQADYTLKRKQKKNVEPLANPRAFFLQSVEKNYAEAPQRPRESKVPARGYDKAPPELQMQQQKVGNRLDSIKQAWRAAKIAEIRSVFEHQDSAKQREILAAVEGQLEARGTIVWQQYQKKGMKAASVAALVFELIFEQNVPEPTAEDLLLFAVGSGKV